MINRIICILYTAGHTYAQLATTDWRIETDKDPVTKKESIILSKRSTSTQIFNYERIYGRLSIRSNGDKLDVYMNWGGFISVGKSYVKCKIGDNELRGDSWLISGEYDITVAPDPFTNVYVREGHFLYNTQRFNTVKSFIPFSRSERDTGPVSPYFLYLCGLDIKDEG